MYACVSMPADAPPPASVIVIVGIGVLPAPVPYLDFASSAFAAVGSNCSVFTSGV